MLIPLREPSSFRYIRINASTNRIHLLVPFIAGLDISTDNTCKSDLELKAFFEGGAVKELESYKSTLEFHLSLLEEGDMQYQAKKERLEQINLYLEAVIGMRNSYKTVVSNFLARSSNLYSVQLRPLTQDPYSRVVNPVFTINRSNDSEGTPLSPLYNKMHEVFPAVRLGKSNPREELLARVLNALPQNASFETIQTTLAAQYNVPDDFFKKRVDERRQEQVVDKAYIDRLMGFDENTQPIEYINALLGLCAPNLPSTLQGSPFYLEVSDNPAERAERLSILTQFYLSVLNVYCRAKEISDKNFGVILDSSPVLSQELVEIVSQALSRGDDVESAIITFFNAHKKSFNISRDLCTGDNGIPNDKAAIQQKFETTFRTVTATKENPHMDDFMFLDTEARGENGLFASSRGLICTDFANIVPITSEKKHYFDEIRSDAQTHQEAATPQDELVSMIDIPPEVLLNKLSDVQWENLPKEIVDACRALPAFKARELLTDVAKGKQSEANAILQSSEDIQTLLRMSGKFTDYSGRTFHCTAYEYAYWAKDTHMCRMLERHMDNETKAILLEKIDEVELSGLAYQQHGVSYQNSHYDMSFVLKNLSVDEFRQLQTIVGQNSPKIQQATEHNYQKLSFTAVEYEALKKILEQYRPTGTSTFFYTSSSAKALSEKLQFDFHSLITALDSYVLNFDQWSHHDRELGLLSVGRAQRDVPAHIAHEYCRPDRSFDPLPSFNEENLPRVLTITNYRTNDKSWFPLASSSSGLGFNFALVRGRSAQATSTLLWTAGMGSCDLAVIQQLDKVRTADLTQSRENLSGPVNQLGLV